jgi:hypothetical protein
MATMENTMFLVLVFVGLITKEALAAQHIVGGSQGWDESTDFDTWASGQTFKVGDQLGMSLMLDSCKDILVLKNMHPLLLWNEPSIDILLLESSLC